MMLSGRRSAVPTTGVMDKSCPEIVVFEEIRRRGWKANERKHPHRVVDDLEGTGPWTGARDSQSCLVFMHQKNGMFGPAGSPFVGLLRAKF